jgi:hypothetical protein
VIELACARIADVRVLLFAPVGAPPPAAMPNAATPRLTWPPLVVDHPLKHHWRP